MKVKVSEVAILNRKQLQYKKRFDVIQYLDTSSVYKGKFDALQVLPVGVDDIPSRAQRAVKDGTIVISTVRPNLEHYGYFEHPSENVIVSSGFVTVDAIPEKVDSKYLYYVLTSPRTIAYLISISATAVSSYPSFNPEDLASFEIEIEDDIKEQKKIAESLSNIDSKISNNTAICSDLEAMAKLLYDYWFVQFDFPDENGKPYKSSGGKMVWNEEMKREIPEGWKVCSVGSVLGSYPKTNSVLRDDYSKGTRFPIIDQSKDYICGYTDDENVVLRMVDAIVFGDHTNTAKYVNFDFARGADGTQIVNSNNLALPNYILYLQICALPTIEEGYSRHFKFLKEQLIIVPNINTSREYMNIISNGLEMKTMMIQENYQLSSLRDFLLPMLMNGQVRVKEGA